MNKKLLFTHFERTYTKNPNTPPTGRPKINWMDKDNPQYDKEKYKVQNNKSISLVKEIRYIKGKIRLHGEPIWVHIGTKHKYGKVRTSILIGKMTDNQLKDEFRFKFYNNSKNKKYRL
jgi:hypothetical protein|tara:strand:- start:52 stop:405 length:354 start_codon:yes stop_codon:yes gene_type:complete